MSDASLDGPVHPAASRIGADYLALARRRRIYSTMLIAIFVALMVSGFQLANGRNAGGFLAGMGRLFDFPAELLGEAWQNADQIPGHMLKFLPSLIQTVNIAATATIIGGAGAVVLSLLASPRLAPFPRAIPVVRRFMDILRALPEIVTALALIFALGGGPVPAMIAITIHTFGALGKLFAEVNENADVKPLEGLTSVGGNWVQRMALGVVPQVAPNWLSYALLRMEINVRASAILGFVGAGGIGYDLKNTISWGQGRYDQAAAVFILLFLTIVVIDQISGTLRNTLIRGAK